MKVAERAKEYAQLYSRLTEELMKTGLTEDLAREEAHAAATSWLLSETTLVVEPSTDPYPCPMCGK